MVYRFLALSDEVDDFLREIKIDSEASFYELHKILRESIGLTQEDMSSFFMCNDDWEKEQEITLTEMDTSSEYDNLVMDKTFLHEFTIDEGQKLLYIFDYFSERALFLELKEIIPGVDMIQPKCTKSIGELPKQVEFNDDIIYASTATTLLDESFFGDEGFDLDELDEEGFSDLESAENIPSEEPGF